MNLLAARVVLRPRPLGDVLDLAVPYCLSGRRLLRRLALGALVPACALCLYLRHARGWEWPPIWLVALLLADLLEGLFTVACGDLLFQGDAQLRAVAVWKRFVLRLPGYLVTLVLARILVTLTLVFVPLLPFAAVRLLFVREANLLEGASVFAGLARSYRFVQRQVGSSLGLLLALVAAPALFVLGGEALGDAIVSDVLQMGSPVGKLFEDGGSAYALCGFFLSVPVTASARFLKYIDVRTRKEGWDIQLRFVAMADGQDPGLEKRKQVA